MKPPFNTEVRDMLRTLAAENDPHGVPTGGVPRLAPVVGALSGQIGGDHYKRRSIQPIEYCHANQLGACESAVVKYITRWREKGGVQDLNKAAHYIELLKELEGLS